MTSNRPKSRRLAFATPREGGNSWAQSDRLIDAWKRQKVLEVPPLTMEFAPILDCNANCPLCPYTRSRHDAGLGVVERGDFPIPNGHTVSTVSTARRALDAAHEAGVRGVLWTGGGEPTIWGPLIEMLSYSASLGMLNCLYTNGFQMGVDPTLAERLLVPETGLVFVRTSVNAVTPRAVKLHWGIELEEVRLQFSGLERLFKAREQHLPRYHITNNRVPSIQFSAIFDKNNVDDIYDVCAKVAQIAATSSYRAAEDVMVVRPLTIHHRLNYSLHDHSEDLIQRIIHSCGANSIGSTTLNEVNYRLFLGFGLDRIESGEIASYSEIIGQAYERRGLAWSNGCFLTVGPSGHAYLSTEHNCDPKWIIGDLNQQSVAEIYGSERRQRILEDCDKVRWGPAVSQPTARTNRLDQIAQAIIAGRLSEAEIADIRIASLQSHCLLLD